MYLIQSYFSLNFIKSELSRCMIKIKIFRVNSRHIHMTITFFFKLNLKGIFYSGLVLDYIEELQELTIELSVKVEIWFIDRENGDYLYFPHHLNPFSGKTSVVSLLTNPHDSNYSSSYKRTRVLHKGCLTNNQVFLLLISHVFGV